MTDSSEGVAERAPTAPGKSAEGSLRKRAHRFLVPTLLVLATLIGFAGTFAVWVNRQALNSDNSATTSGKLLANKQIQSALSTYMVNELFTNVDVAARLKTALP